MKELRLQISHLKKRFTRPVLTDISLSMENHDFVAIVGKSGCGKSTLMNIIGLIEQYDSGTYTLNGVSIRNDTDYSRLRRETIGFIFQSYNLISTLTCRENILLPTLYGRRQGADVFDELVSELDIEHLLSQRVNTLSGGEKQRVAIARSLMLDPCLLIADEPTGNLDPQNKDIILNLLRTQNRKGRGIILITHDQETAQAARTRYTLKGGVLLET